ncbi:MAG: heavy metal-binding domain-containing protein [Elusimicrobiales bacterium]
MKETLVSLALILSLSAASAVAHCGKCPGDKKAGEEKAAVAKPGKKDCGDCPTHKKQGAKKCGGMTCPEKIKGAQTVSKNIENGVEVTITAKALETVAQIQELAVVHYSPKAEKCPGCPTTVPGAETRAVNIETGVKVTTTGKTPETVKMIQEASAKEHSGGHAADMRGPAKARAAQQAKRGVGAAGKYTCAMKCVTADKPGKCPKCGMPMEEVK